MTVIDDATAFQEDDSMFRTTSKTLIFARSFKLKGVDRIQPAGAYIVETDEELMLNISFPAYRRVAVRIALAADPDRPGTMETAVIDGAELDATMASSS